MRYLFLLLLPASMLINGCQKDGTEKRCPKGYTGRNCDQEITPSKIQLTSIKALTMPAFDGSSNWDPLGGKPDIYFKIIEESSGQVVFKSVIHSNYNPTQELLLNTIDNNILIHSPESRYSIQAWDHDDLDADDYMGGVTFTPYVKGADFPAQRFLYCTGCNTSWELSCTYLF